MDIVPYTHDGGIALGASIMIMLETYPLDSVTEDFARESLEALHRCYDEVVNRAI
jgi:hypothetical protein